MTNNVPFLKNTENNYQLGFEILLTIIHDHRTSLSLRRTINELHTPLQVRLLHSQKHD